MLGRAAVAMWWDIPPSMQAEFEDWHSHEHMPERLGIPGFLRGTRWIGLSGDPCYFVLYEAADIDTLTGGAYLERLNKPTPWSRKMMPYHQNMVRSLCRVRASFGRGTAHALATIRFSPSPGGADALAARTLPALPQRRGLTEVHLLESQPMGMVRTTEQKIRGNDAVADWVLLIGGYDLESVRAAAQNDLGAHALPGAVCGLYRMAYCLTGTEIA